ncbi:hypothetical protein HA402_014363 [Bradysia odoriphaga]|nr:hypothetical protein HA402_014363 [Bradysia odoriphaga]
MKCNLIAVVFVVALVMVAVVDNVNAQGTIVDACNEVCGRTAAERKECCRAHGYKLGRRFSCTVIALLVTLLNVVDFTKREPATICKWTSCSWSLFSRRAECYQIFDLRIRNRYQGIVRSAQCDEANTDRCAESFLRRRCSSHAVFCIEAIRRTDTRFILRYGNLDMIVSGGRTEDAEEWCRLDRQGTAYWLDL